MNFSVCIPTYNRSAGLVRALNSFHNQTYDKAFEIIVCDNACDPHVERIVNKYDKKSKYSIRYVSQRGGIQQVRSRLVLEANNELIIMIDDDESASPNLLSEYHRLFLENQNIVAAGGPCIVAWDETPPGWVFEYLKNRPVSNLWGRFEPCSQMTIGADAGIWGGNMAFRRQIFKETGFRPDVFLGKNYGDGETGLMIDIVKRGYLIAFVPEAFIFHHMDSSRFKLQYVRRTASYTGIPTSYYRWHKRKKSICRLLFNGAKVISKYYGTWSKLLIYRILSRNITSRRVGLEFRSYSGLYQLMYIYWLATDPFCRACCDMEDFRPESCLQIYRDHYEKKTD